NSHATITSLTLTTTGRRKPRPPLRNPPRRKFRDDGFVSGSMGRGSHRTGEVFMDAGSREKLEARRKIAFAFRVLLRGAQHGLGFARRGNPASGAARARRRKHRPRRNDAESRSDARLFRRHAASPLTRRVSPVSESRSTAISRRGGLRRLDVQKQIRKRAGDNDDRFAWTGVRAEPAFHWIWRGSGLHGSHRRKNVPPVLQGFRGDHKKRRVSRVAEQAWHLDGTGHGHGLDI